MEGRGEIPASVGTPNYIDLNDPDIIMPHDDEASVRRFVDDVKVAFVNAERCSAYRFQPDVSPPRRRAALRSPAARPSRSQSSVAAECAQPDRARSFAARQHRGAKSPVLGR